MDSDVERERVERLTDAREGTEPDWADAFRPGSLGCHELMDRASIVADTIDGVLLSHPSCLLNPEWYALADRAAKAIYDLYQRIGTVHPETIATDTSRPATRDH